MIQRHDVIVNDHCVLSTSDGAVINAVVNLFKYDTFKVITKVYVGNEVRIKMMFVTPDSVIEI